MRRAVITIMAATLSVGPIGSALAIVSTNGGSENGVQVNGTQLNGGSENGIHVNGVKVNGQGTQGVSLNGATGATVIAIELPAPAAF